MSTLLRIETAVALHLAWVLVFVVPLRITRRLFGAVESPRDGEITAVPPQGRAFERATDMARRLRRVADRLPWHSTCLVRAVAGQLLLTRRGIEGGSIRFGVRKQDGKLEAHAWLLLDGVALIGGEEAEGYLPLADLGQARPASDHR